MNRPFQYGCVVCQGKDTEVLIGTGLTAFEVHMDCIMDLVRQLIILYNNSMKK